MPNSKYIVGDPKIDGMIEKLSQGSLTDECGSIVREIITTAVKLGREHDDMGDFKLINSSLKELRHSLRVFLPYRDVKKVAIFGSARTPESDPCYKMAFNLTELLVRNGFMAISGAGGGIMQAVNHGAGPEKSFGLNINLPFEQFPNHYIEGDPKLMNFKYFFTRKLMFIKESDATVLFPGGFGTLDEGYENLTILQTGKTMPRPIILMEPENGVYWKTWFQYMDRELRQNGFISDDDLKLFHISHSIEEGAQRIFDFYRVYHSLRYVKELSVLRFTKPIPQVVVDRLNDEYVDIIREGEIRITPPLPDEEKKNECLDLPRLVFNFNKQNFGRLLEMIRSINQSPEI